MTDSTIILASWEISPTVAPQPIRNCPGCARSRNFASSGRVRLNANGKRLDAWLIYKCTHCDNTWNRPLVERKPVGQISAAELAAMQQSSPEWVRLHEFDATGLRKHCQKVHYASEFTLAKKIEGALPLDWSQIRLNVSCEFQTGLRLERILCEGWRLSRAQLKKIANDNCLHVLADTGNAMRKPLRGTVSIKVLSSGLSEEMKLKLFEGLSGERY